MPPSSPKQTRLPSDTGCRSSPSIASCGRRCRPNPSSGKFRTVPYDEGGSESDSALLEFSAADAFRARHQASTAETVQLAPQARTSGCPCNLQTHTQPTRNDDNFETFDNEFVGTDKDNEVVVRAYEVIVNGQAVGVEKSLMWESDDADNRESGTLGDEVVPYDEVGRLTIRPARAPLASRTS